MERENSIVGSPKRANGTQSREEAKERERDVEGGRKLVYKEAMWGKKRRQEKIGNRARRQPQNTKSHT
ncbi:hypothetical protein PV325_008305 [Microctonus aethiopoides]|nr:hypothetical protein PV325_008305 [Microctonus aethiopoides]